MSTTRCVECFNPTHTSINGVCSESCPPGAKLVGEVCVCTFGFEYSGSCVSSCPEGFYAVNKKCEPCQNPCKACNAVATNCLNCREGY